QSGHCPSGACVECVAASTCPGQDTECQTRACAAHACGFSFVGANTPITTQVLGDCHTNRCNGSGGITNAVDNADVPVDNNQCTNDVCTSGTPSNPFLGMVPCGNGSFCNGMGQCSLQCVNPSTCPGVNDDCKTKTCNGGLCGFDYQPPGTLTSGQS